jgi:hypothetical protein
MYMPFVWMGLVKAKDFSPLPLDAYMRLPCKLYTSIFALLGTPAAKRGEKISIFLINESLP